VGFEPKFPALERARTVHALGRAATVIGPALPLPREKINEKLRKLKQEIKKRTKRMKRELEVKARRK
jgi:hypothetical protein